METGIIKTAMPRATSRPMEEARGPAQLARATSWRSGRENNGKTSQKTNGPNLPRVWENRAPGSAMPAHEVLRVRSGRPYG